MNIGLLCMVIPDFSTWLIHGARRASRDEVAEINEIISSCQGISRTELANTVCELFNWKRPNGRLKTVECRQLLEYLEFSSVHKPFDYLDVVILRVIPDRLMLRLDRSSLLSFHTLILGLNNEI